MRTTTYKYINKKEKCLEVLAKRMIGTRPGRLYFIDFDARSMRKLIGSFSQYNNNLYMVHVEELSCSLGDVDDDKYFSKYRLCGARCYIFQCICACDIKNALYHSMSPVSF